MIMVGQDELVQISVLEAAINRCNTTLGRQSLLIVEDRSVVDDKLKIALSKDASLMAEVYALMIWNHRQACALTDLSAAQREAFSRWNPLG